MRTARALTVQLQPVPVAFKSSVPWTSRFYRTLPLNVQQEVVRVLAFTPDPLQELLQHKAVACSGSPCLAVLGQLQPMHAACIKEAGIISYTHHRL